MTILVIDNYDSFTWNIVQQVYRCAPARSLKVIRNDEWTLEDVRSFEPACLIISPGPGNPDTSKVSLECVLHLHRSLPILGVCLGHQVIAQAFGAVIDRADEPIHGKSSHVFHEGIGLFEGVPSPFQAARYHSLIADPYTMPDDLRVTARLEDGTIMALEHKKYPVFGVQFHPESFMTNEGDAILKNFFRQVLHD